MFRFEKSTGTVVCLLIALFVSAVRSDAFSSSVLHPTVPSVKRTGFQKHTTTTTIKKSSSFSQPRTTSLLTTRTSSSENNENGNDEKADESEALSSSSSSSSIPRGGGADVSKHPPPPLPCLSTYIKFALPCLGLWVAQPLLSLVDTSFVGLSGGAENSAKQLAALGPATTFFDGATYLFAFLNVATTNLYSSARAQNGEQSNQAESVVRTASRVAWRCGLGLMVFLLLFSRPLLALYIGTLLLNRVWVLARSCG